MTYSQDGERDGEYEPYVKRSYALDSDLELRGIPKLDASNNLYFDGDQYESDGTVTRRYGVVDLGTLDWNYEQDRDLFEALLVPRAKSLFVAVCSNYPFVGSYSALVDKSCGYIYGYHVAIKDSTYGTDATAFKTAMSGVYLVYELEEPTTEEAEPYQQTQVVDDFGTEEFVDAGNRDVAIPVGHITRYAPNLRAKLEMSPNSPDGDGDYIVRQTNGENVYISFASNATIQDMLARIEALEGGGE